MHTPAPETTADPSTAKPSTSRLSGWAHARRYRRSRSGLEHEVTVVYRNFDATGNLLYVGVSRRPGARHAAHEKESPWYANVATTTYTRYRTRSEAHAEEARIIREERPLHNRNGGTRSRLWASARPVLPGTDTQPGRPAFLLPRERVLATLAAATSPMSFTDICRMTPGKTQAVRAAIDEVLASGEAVSEKGRNGNRVVIAGREHLLRRCEPVRPSGEIRDRIVAALQAATGPLSLAATRRLTGGKTCLVAAEVARLVAEGVVREQRGPRRARLLTVVR